MQTDALACAVPVHVSCGPPEQHSASIRQWSAKSIRLSLKWTLPWKAMPSLQSGCSIPLLLPEHRSAALHPLHLLAGEPKYQNYFHRASAIPALGSSGAVNGIVMFDILLFPSSTIMLYGVLPMPAWGLGALFLSYDIWGALGVSPSWLEPHFQIMAQLYHKSSLQG